MKVLSIGTDRKMFEVGSAVLARSIEYASKMDELHVIVFSLKKVGLKPKSIGNLYLYPTNSTSRLWYVVDAIKLGKKIISGNKFVVGGSVISTQDPFETGLAGYFLKRKFNFPLQFQLHTDFLSPYFKNTLLNRIRVSLAKFLIPRAQGLRVVSTIITDSIKRNFPGLKITPDVLPIFVDIHKIIEENPLRDMETDFPRFKFIILMASRLTKEKRIDVALRAFKKVVGQFPFAGLVIVGDGEDRTKLENLTKKLGIVNNVIFLGWQNDLVSFCKTADVFLLTSEYEGYGMTLVEAGAAGCPIITSRVGLANTPLFENGKNAFVCPVNDEGCFSRAILELITNNAKRELFRREIKDSIKNVMTTKEEYTIKYVGLLEKLIK